MYFYLKKYMNNIKLSIIVPVYNVEKYVSRCIDSILNQEYRNIELILIDDGSTDESGAICDSYKNDSRVRVFHQKNKGVSSARNLGIEVSEGEYLIFADADDWFAKNAFSEIIYNCDDADLVMFGAYNYTEHLDGEYILTERYSFSKKLPYGVTDVYADIFGKSVVLWNKMIKREVILDLRFDVNKSYGEDADFLCKVLGKVSSAYVIPKNLYYYYNNRRGNVVSARVDGRSLELIENTKEIYDILAKKHHAEIGFARILIVANEVISKIPLTFADTRHNVAYLRAVVDLLKYPSLKERIHYYLNPYFGKGTRIKYFCMQFEPHYMYFRLLKRKLIS